MGVWNSFTSGVNVLSLWHNVKRYVRVIFMSQSCESMNELQRYDMIF